jgi:hypothetical protein
MKFHEFPGWKHEILGWYHEMLGWYHEILGKMQESENSVIFFRNAWVAKT